MSTTAFFVNQTYQNKAIEHFNGSEIPHRVKKDRKLLFAKKWVVEFEDFCDDISLDTFEQPAYCRRCTYEQYLEIIHKLAEFNLPWFAYVINDEYSFFYDDHDTELIMDISWPILGLE